MMPKQKKLIRLFSELEDAQQELLLEFTEFLHIRAQANKNIPLHPISIPRPATENVLNAIKRLAATYPMLARDQMFNETSGLMTSHIMEGRPASEVIDELEILFNRHFLQWQSETKND